MLAAVGFLMIGVFTTLIMTRRVTAIVALILVPMVFALTLGAGPRVGDMMLGGVRETAPTAVLLLFAILYFGLMIDVGLFEPLVRRIVRWAGDDPVRVTVGHAALASAVALDGDGTTTFLVTVSALLPVYRRLGLNPLVFAVIGGGCITIMNMSPWGGPAARAATALKIEPAELFMPLLPTMLIGLGFTFALAWWLGRRERSRLRSAAPAASTVVERDLGRSAFDSDPAARRPRLTLFNLLLTVVLMTAVVLHLAPLPALFMTGCAVALLVNYPSLADQRARMLAHAPSVLSVAILVLAAGSFTGVLSATGMVQAMSASVVAVTPPALGPAFAPVTALLSAPLTFFLSNDAFYFGVLPVLADAARSYGVSPAEMGRAALLGQPVHGLSPLVAAVYLQCALLNVELSEVQKFSLKYAAATCGVLIAAALITGAIPLMN